MGKPARIALFDIETAPNKVWCWGMYQQDAIDVDTEWYILCFAYKWLGEKKTHTHALIDYPTFKKDRENDKELIKDLWKVLDEADIVIAHNGDKFDIKKSNTRFLVHGLLPPSPYKTIDTLKIARKNFSFGSNRLDALGKSLRIGRKLKHTGFHLWKACMEGEREPWQIMRRYNARDVELLERFYLKTRAWHSTHPDLNIYTNTHDCPACRSTRVQRRGIVVAKKRKYQKYQCQDCGHWSQGMQVL